MENLILNKLKNKLIKIRVITNAKEENIAYDKDKEAIVIRVKERAQNNLANKAVIALFKKKLNLKIEIVSGLKNKNKIIRILD